MLLGFSGYHEHQMDDKGRIRIPPVYRRELGDHPIIFCNRFERCLWVYKEEDFKTQVIDRFKGGDILNKDLNMIKRAIFSSTQELVEDKQGRIALNSSFIEKCGLVKDLITIGVEDHIEIWSAEVYNEYQEQADFNDILAHFSSSRNQI